MNKEVCVGGGVHEGEREDGGRGEDTYMSGEVEGGRKDGVENVQRREQGG